MRKILITARELAAALRERAISTTHMMSSPDRRWALVTSSVTASVALSITALALSSMPSSEGSRYEQMGLIAPSAITTPTQHLIEAVMAAVPPVEKRTLRVSAGETIMGMLQGAGVPSKDATAIVAAISPIYSPRNIRSGQTFEVTFSKPEAAPPPVAANTSDEDDSVAERTRRLLSLSFEPSVERQITVNLSDPDKYLAHDVQRNLEGRHQHAGGKIDSSLYLAAMQAGIPANIVVEMIRIFSYDLDFQRDVHPGDSFEVFYNHYFTQEGRPARPGEIVSAAMTISGRTHTLYRYESGGDVEYFDPLGRSSKSLLMKTPVDGARISSTFGRRSHPILGYTRMHKGIDFAVPSGTPVMAAGNGTVTYSDYSSGFGNLLVVSHAAGYTTAYAHLSKFSARAGTHVRQGQVIAYSGKTGLATGPHLHYEVRMNNSQLNPATIKVASGRTLTGSALSSFQRERAQVDSLMAAQPMQRKLAIVSDLRNTTE